MTSAPNSTDLSSLCLLISIAITLDPILLANITADNPTGSHAKDCDSLTCF